MDLYTRVAYDLSRRLTLAYSSSFGLASRLYGRSVRPHIYALYGMVRVADEIVDTYDGRAREALLASFREDVMLGVRTGYSTNPIVHAFADTARRFDIGADLIDPFFDSMRMDLTKTAFTPAEYDAYVYGSAEVIGLMCLKVFCSDDPARYTALAPGARLLGSAYQKVNFLRDLRADYEQRGRVYFPDVTYDGFTDGVKDAIVNELTREFEEASHGIDALPKSARRAVRASYGYYHMLLERLARMSAHRIKHERAHVPTSYKLWTLLTSGIRG